MNNDDFDREALKLWDGSDGPTNAEIIAFAHAIRDLLVPDGSVVVPREPTEKMLDAGHKCAVIHYEWGEDLYVENIDAVYKAMLEAAKEE